VGEIKVAFTAGKTGGHIYPAISCATTWQNIEPTFIIPGSNLGNKPWEAFGFAAHIIPFKRSIFGVVSTFRAAKRVLTKVAPDILISTGGVTTIPVCLAAKAKGIPIVLLEQNTIPGRSNLFLQRIARYVCVTFPESLRFFSRKKAVVTGNPILRPSVACDHNDGILKELSSYHKNVLIVGGSQGAKALNEFMLKHEADMLTSPFNFIHILGHHHNHPLESGVEYCRDESGNGRIARVSYVSNMLDLLAKVDCVISRAGATAISEILRAELPSVLIPFPYSRDDHQLQNAKSCAKEGLCSVIIEKELSWSKVLSCLNKWHKTKIKCPKWALNSEDAVFKVVQKTLRI